MKLDIFKRVKLCISNNYYEFLQTYRLYHKRCWNILYIAKDAGNNIDFSVAKALLKIPQPLLLKTKQYQTRVY